MISKGARGYGFAHDAIFELYFTGEATARYNIVFDLYMEKESKGDQVKLRHPLGWMFSPLKCLPAIRKELTLEQQSATTASPLLKGTSRQLLNAFKEKFSPNNQGLSLRVDSELLSERL